MRRRQPGILLICFLTSDLFYVGCVCARVVGCARVALRCARVLCALLLNARIRNYQKNLAIFGYESVTVLRQEF